MEKYWTLAHNLSNGHAPSPKARNGERSNHWVTQHGLLNKEPDRMASVNDLVKNHHLSMYDRLAHPEDRGISDPDRSGRNHSDAFTCGSERMANDEYVEWTGHSGRKYR